MTSNRIAISTGGGDAPGLSAVIRAIVLSALNRGWECVGIRDGYNGLLAPEDYPEGGLIALDRTSVRGLTHLGGTILGTTNRGNPLRVRRQERRRFEKPGRSVGRTDRYFPPAKARRADHHRRRRHAGHRQRPLEEGAAGRWRAQDDRQRPRSDGRDVRVPLGREFRHGVHRSAALHGPVAPADHGGRGDGSHGRVDCGAQRPGRAGGCGS